MEPFRSNLSSYRLPLVVPALFDGKLLTATLVLRRGAVEREFVFREGLLVAQSSNEPREHLAQVLSNLGMLEVGRSAAAFEAARGAGIRLGSFLVERGFVDQARLLEALAHKAREAFFDCYAWENGELELHPCAGVKDEDRGVALRIPLGALHRDGLARLREWRAFREIFAGNDATFRVHRHMGVDWRSEEEELLLQLAERGASLGELLATAPEGQLFAARRVLQLYRRGVLSPRTPRGLVIGEAPDVEHLVTLTRSLLVQGQFEAAAAVAAQALEVAPVPEACELYREAELRMALAISDEVLEMEGRLDFAPVPRPAPAHLTADDLYLYALLKGARSIRQALQSAAMGELAAYKCVRRLVAARLIRVRATVDPNPRQRRTNPYGMPAIS